MLYYSLCHLFYYDIYHFISNIKEKSWKIIFFNPMVVGYLGLYSVMIFLYVFKSQNHPTPIEWIENIKKNCEIVEGLDADPEVYNF